MKKISNAACLNLLAVSLLISAGCSKPQPQENELPQKKSPEVSQPGPAPAPRPAPAAVKPASPAARPQKKQKPVLVTNHKPTIRITALMKRGDAAPRVGIVQDSSGDWAILRQGQAFKGYRVDEIDYDNSKVLLDWNGQAISLTLEGAVVKKVIAPAAPTADSKPTIAKMVYSDATFTPTAAEIAAGIDPNDAQTWPENYRGPAIERIAAEMGDEPPQMDMKDLGPIKTFEPTANELARGIDPNSPKTWPEGYRGPAIERIALERGDNQKNQPPMPQIQPPDGTPEEIKQRFLEKYAPKGDQGANKINLNKTNKNQGNMMMSQIPAK